MYYLHEKSVAKNRSWGGVGLKYIFFASPRENFYSGENASELTYFIALQMILESKKIFLIMLCLLGLALNFLL